MSSSVFEHSTGSVYYSVHGVDGNSHIKAGLLGEERGNTGYTGAASRQAQSAFDDFAGGLGGQTFQQAADSVRDYTD